MQIYFSFTFNSSFYVFHTTHQTVVHISLTFSYFLSYDYNFFAKALAFQILMRYNSYKHHLSIKQVILFHLLQLIYMNKLVNLSLCSRKMTSIHYRRLSPYDECCQYDPSIQVLAFVEWTTLHIIQAFTVGF